MVNAGVLNVTGVSSGPVVVTQMGANTFNVADSVYNTTFINVTRDVVVKFTGNNPDDLTIDLGGFKAPGAITAQLGDGTNNFTLKGNGGRVTGLVNLFGGTGADTVTLGDGNALTLGGINLNPYGGADAVEIQGGVTTGSIAANAVETIAVDAGAVIAGSLTTTLSRIVNLAATARITGSATFNLAPGDATVTSAADIDGGLAVNGYAFSSLNTPNLNLTGGTIKGNVFLNAGAYNFAGFVTLDIASGAVVNGQVTVTGGGGGDQITVAGTIGVALNARLGAGNDTVAVTGSVGTAGQRFYSINIDAGAGDDLIDLGGAASLKGGIVVLMGSGDDTFVVNTGVLTKEGSAYLLYVDGGSHTAGLGDKFKDVNGTYTFTGPNSATVKVLGFESAAP